MDCREAARTSKACSLGRWRVVGNVSSLDDGCSQEGTPVIYLVIPSQFPISNPTCDVYEYRFFAKRLHVLRGDNKSYPSYAVGCSGRP